MKDFRRFCAAVTLTLALTLSAFAGHITTWNTDPPPPPPDSTQTAGGHISTWNSEASASSMEAILSLLQSVLPLF